MKVKDIVEILKCQVLNEANMEEEVKTACGSDMMSDVLAFVKDQSVLLNRPDEPPGGAHGRNDGHALHRVRPGKENRRCGGWPAERDHRAGIPLQDVYGLRAVVFQWAAGRL